MPSIVKILRVVADPNRLRILLLLKGEELSVAELQEILVMGQSTISTHLSQLKQAGLVEDRRTGKSSLYRLSPSERQPFWSRSLPKAKAEIPEAVTDQASHAPRPAQTPGQDARLLRLRGRPPRQGLRPRQILEERSRSPPPPHASHDHRRPRRRRRRLRPPARRSAPPKSSPSTPRPR